MGHTCATAPYKPDGTVYGWCPRCRVWQQLYERVKALGKLCEKCDKEITEAVLAAEAR